MRKVIITLMFFVSIKNYLSAENGNLKANIGFGLGESAYCGIEYRYKSVSTGIDVGTLDLLRKKDGSLLTLTMDNSLYFLKKRKFDLRTWFVNARLVYQYYDCPEYVISGLIYAGPSIGREINFTNKIGISLDAGFLFPIYYKAESKNINEETPFLWRFPYPELKAGIFYRL
ncbi:MAG: hypothetical protein JXB17_10080 [Bacteroidales bacterium]|nr:hypothetical protein [Bacteroidales bacterium]